MSLMLPKPLLLGWFFQVLLVWNVAWFLYTTVIVVSAYLWGWLGTCFHRLPFWISKLLWLCSQLWFSLLHEFHKLGFWMDVWGLAFRELYLFPRCRTQDLSFTVLVWQLQKLYLPAPSLFHYTGHLPFLNKPQFSYIFGFSLNKWALVMPHPACYPSWNFFCQIN